jgi:hypothetical protein
MKTESTFTGAGWDFVNETANGTEDIWTIKEDVNYPEHVWPLVHYVGWDIVNFLDYSFFADYYGKTDCNDINDCNSTDLDFSGAVDSNDVNIFKLHWLKNIPPITKASGPTPADGASGQQFFTALSWQAGENAISHNVYFGTDFNQIRSATPTDPQFMANLVAKTWNTNNYDSEGLGYSKTYHWRIDEIGLWNSRAKGDVWSFTTIGEPNEYLEAWWEFEEGEGDKAYDSAGDNDGILTNDPCWVAGLVGDYALEFDGFDDYLDLGNDVNLKPALPVTLCAWVKLDVLGHPHSIIRLDDQSTRYYGIWLTVNTNNNVTIAYGDGQQYLNSKHRRSKASTSTLLADTLYHIACVVRGATDMEIYINGIDDGGTYSGTGGSLAYSSQSSSIGYRRNYDQTMDGIIDDVRVYDRALTGEEIQEIYEEVRE